jgi:hypothetical protein
MLIKNVSVSRHFEQMQTLKIKLAINNTPCPTVSLFLNFNIQLNCRKNEVYLRELKNLKLTTFFTTYNLRRREHRILEKCFESIKKIQFHLLLLLFIKL